MISLEILGSALQLGLLYSVPAIAVTFLFRVIGFPDLTPDGSFVLGAVIAVQGISLGYSSVVVFTCAFLVGAIAGSVTALIHKLLGVSKLLSGILVGLALYSLCLRILGSSNAMIGNAEGLLESLLGNSYWFGIMVAGFVALLFFSVIYLLLITRFGLLLRALGDAETSFFYRGISTVFLTTLGVAIGNGVMSLSGVIISRYQGFVDISMGTGLVISSLTAMIIGESIIKPHTTTLLLVSPILGSIIFQVILSIAITVGFQPTDLKAIICVMTLVFLFAQKYSNKNSIRSLKQIGNRSI